MSLQFDHTKDTLSECMGMPEKQLEELQLKLANITTDYVMNGKRDRSKTVEKIANQLSYSELLFCCMGYIESIVDKDEQESNHPLNNLKNIVKKFRK